MKRILATLSLSLFLGACASGSGTDVFGGNSSSGGLGVNSMVKMAVDNQCRTELANRNEWRVIALAMTAEKQREWEDKICGCASEEAMQQITANDMMQMVNTSTRNQAVAGITARTVTACVKRLYR
ncbi:hypothetical protein [Neisseria sp.]|uniref:hypothetical protein n=1 Tax=Neisseria sp. TaxID=192066 RepID=UPI00289733CA|nr:hypothetical protein [Neisseria sp.]